MDVHLSESDHEYNSFVNGCCPIGSNSPQIPGRDPRGIPNDFPGRANISFYNSPHRKKNLVLKVRTVTQAFAVYPGRPNLISNSTLIKLEGTFSNEGISVDMERCEGWMLLMPDSEGAGSEEMLRWLIGGHVPPYKSFQVY